MMRISQRIRVKGAPECAHGEARVPGSGCEVRAGNSRKSLAVGRKAVGGAGGGAVILAPQQESA
jgi:hypothetical protein